MAKLILEIDVDEDAGNAYARAGYALRDSIGHRLVSLYTNGNNPEPGAEQVFRDQSNGVVATLRVS